jgi:hypothetical protein
MKGKKMKKLTLDELNYISSALDHLRAIEIDKREWQKVDEIIELRNKIEKEIK